MVMPGEQGLRPLFGVKADVISLTQNDGCDASNCYAIGMVKPLMVKRPLCYGVSHRPASRNSSSSRLLAVTHARHLHALPLSATNKALAVPGAVDLHRGAYVHPTSGAGNLARQNAGLGCKEP